ncbi:putative Ig domain-containing protein [Saccharospirillum alexandrii]|uniref:putative Ig domain-containing protein n=1 Tax=Saccharospirillum alexandrii TaxID=2448477 RepID=UPI0013DF34D3|nr:putative Ig domain-containing protein [Saccharospirillum alexandrii]
MAVVNSIGNICCSIAVSLLCLVPITGVAGNLPFEIVQPQEGLDTNSRFYKAYPGLEYRVRLAVMGGSYPYAYELQENPDGMTINRLGEIVWPEPSARTNPYAISVLVTDTEGLTEEVSWQVTVTKAGFFFVDAENGRSTSSGGRGTLENPWRSMGDVYGDGGKFQANNPDGFVYWRNGEYSLEGEFEDCNSSEGCRLAWYAGKKPSVWLAYPGERPTINFNRNGVDGYILFDQGTDNLYIDGFRLDNNSNTRGKSLSIVNNGNITIRNNIFEGLTNCESGGNNSHLFFPGGDGRYLAVQDNLVSDSCGYWLLGYSSPYAVVESNDIYSDIPLPIGPKSNIENWTIRANHIKGQTSLGAIWNQEYGYSGSIEINYNLIEMENSNGVAVKLLSSNPGGEIFVNRNTLIGHVVVQSLQSTKGPWYFEENIIINDSSNSDKISRSSTVDESRLIVNNNLVGNGADGIIGDNGQLTEEYSEYLGQRGHQLGTEPRGPAPARAVYQ